jgi:hypothetical protein
LARENGNRTPRPRRGPGGSTVDPVCFEIELTVIMFAFLHLPDKQQPVLVNAGTLVSAVVASLSRPGEIYTKTSNGQNVLAMSTDRILEDVHYYFEPTTGNSLNRFFCYVVFIEFVTDILLFLRFSNQISLLSKHSYPPTVSFCKKQFRTDTDLIYCYIPALLAEIRDYLNNAGIGRKGSGSDSEASTETNHGKKGRPGIAES